MRTAFWIMLSLAALGVVLVAALKRALHAVRQQMQAAMDDRFEPEEILRKELDANFLGQSSDGPKQSRGNGGLALTRDRLWFLLFEPPRELVVPLTSVRFAGTRRSHLGKVCMLPLLYVEYDNEGEPDAAAWAVEDAEAWAKAVDAARLEQSA